MGDLFHSVEKGQTHNFFWGGGGGGGVLTKDNMLYGFSVVD